MEHTHRGILTLCSFLSVFFSDNPAGSHRISVCGPKCLPHSWAVCQTGELWPVWDFYIKLTFLCQTGQMLLKTTHILFLGEASSFFNLNWSIWRRKARPIWRFYISLIWLKHNVPVEIPIVFIKPISQTCWCLWR